MRCTAFCIPAADVARNAPPPAIINGGYDSTAEAYPFARGCEPRIAAC